MTTSSIMFHSLDPLWIIYATWHNSECTYNVTLWRVTSIAKEMQQWVPFFTELHVMVNNIQHSKVSREMQQWVLLYCSRPMYLAVNNIKWYVGHVKCMILRSFNKFGFCWQILIKVSQIKLHENQSSGGWVVTCRWWREVTKLLADFCNYLNVPTKINFFIASVPHASECNVRIGLALFPNLTQNRWLILCSKFQIPIF